MCNETGTSVKLGTLDETKISWNEVESDNNIYPVRKGIWWNLGNAEVVINPYYDSTNFVRTFIFTTMWCVIEEFLLSDEIGSSNGEKR